MRKSKISKFAITLATVTIVAIAIAALHVPAFAEKTLRIGYYPT